MGFRGPGNVGNFMIGCSKCWGQYGGEVAALRQGNSKHGPKIVSFGDARQGKNQTEGNVEKWSK